MRGAGAALLHNISAHGELPERSSYVQRSKTAVAEALAAENDDVARHQMDQYLKLIVDEQF